MNELSIILAIVVIAVIALVIYNREYFYTTTYVSTPGFTGVYPTNITDYYWRDRYIDRLPYVRYAAVPYLPWRGRPIWRPRRGRFYNRRRFW